MRNLPVHWFEGMFLRPHHFQAAERCWTETLQTSERFDHHYCYGLRQLEYSNEALLNSQFQLNACQARMKDGTLVSLGPWEEPDRVDIKPALDDLAKHVVDLQEAFQSGPVVRVFLAVPKLRLGAPNVSTGGADNSHEPQRYKETVDIVQDESRGGNDQELRFRATTIRILLSTQDLSGYELLPIAEIQRTGMNDATPQLNVEYIPPLLAIDAWPPLGREIVRAVYDMVGNKIQVLSQQVISRGITLVSQEPGDLDRLFMLAQLNEAFSTLGVLTFAQGVHPFQAYTELCRYIGKLGIFSPERRPPELPHYDHDDLGLIFRELKKAFETLLHAIREQVYQQRFFVRAGLGMQVSLESLWLNADWKWYVGVTTADLTDADCRELLSPGQLDWKFGSSRQVEIIFQQGISGLNLTALERTPQALPGKNWLYYEVARDNLAWRDVQATQTLAMRFKDTLVVNRTVGPDERMLVVNWRGKRVGLQFALFAVPMNV